MTNQPNPTPPTNPNSAPKPSFPSRFLGWVKHPYTLAAGGLFLAVGTGGGYWGYWYLRENLPPLIEAQVSKIINRPVKIGAVQGLSLTGIKFGATSIPPTATDTDNISLASIAVNFNLFSALFTRTLPVTVNLEELEVYLDQDKQGNWVNLELQLEPGGEPLPINLDITIALPKADIILLPQGEKNPLKLQVETTANFQDNQKIIAYDLGLTAPRGTVKIKGETAIKTGKTRATTRIHQLSLPPFSALIPQRPIRILEGEINANLDIDLPSFQEMPSLQGNFGFKSIRVAAKELPRIATASGLLRFQGKKVRLEEVKGGLGEIVASVAGNVDLDKGYNLGINVGPFTLENLMATLPMPKLPVDLTGEMQLNLQVNGAVMAPVVTGNLASKKITRIDRVELGEVSASFFADMSQFALTSLWVSPATGGKITGFGGVQFPAKQGEEIKFEFDVAADIPLDAIASPYGKPPDITLGDITATATLRGTPTKPQALLQYSLPAATIPTVGKISSKGEIDFSNNNIRLRNTRIETNSGNLTVTANANLDTNLWQANLSAATISLNQTPFPLQLDAANITATGSLKNLTPNAIQAAANLQIGIANSQLIANTQLTGGNLNLSARLNNLSLNSLLPDLPATAFLQAVNINANTTTDTLTRIATTGNYWNWAGINVDTNTSLTIGTGIVKANTQLNNRGIQLAARLDDLSLNRIIPDLPTTVSILGTDVNFSASTVALSRLATKGDYWDWGGIQADVNSRLAVAGGIVTANTRLNSGGVNVAARLDDLSLNRIVPNLPAPVSILGTDVNLTASTVALSRIATKGDYWNWGGIQADVNSSLAVAGAFVNANTRLNSGGVELAAKVDNLSLNRIIPDLPAPVSILGTDVNLTASTVALSRIATKGDYWNWGGINVIADTRLGVAGGIVDAQTRLNYNGVNLAASVTNLSLAGIIPNLPAPVSILDTDLNLSASTAALSRIATNGDDWNWAGIQADVNSRLAIASGIVNAQTRLNSRGVNLAGRLDDLSLNQLVPNLPAAVSVATTNFNLNAAPAALSRIVNRGKIEDFAGITAAADTRLLVADGIVNANTELNNRGLQLSATVADLSLSGIIPNLPAAVSVVRTNFKLNAATTALSRIVNSGKIEDLTGITADAVASLAVARGKVETIARLNQNQWQTNLTATDILLTELKLPLPDNIDTSDNRKLTLNAQANLSGDIKPLLNPDSQPLAIQANAISVQLGEQFIDASGNLTLANFTTKPDISQLNLNLALNANLPNLPVILPPNINPRGGVNFNGRIIGANLLSNPLAPGNFQLTGDLQLRQVAINQLALAPVMAGKINLEPAREISLDLQGNQDKIAATIQPCTESRCLFPYLPGGFDVRLLENGETPIIVTGKRRGDILEMGLENFSLALLNIAPGQETGFLKPEGSSEPMSLGEKPGFWGVVGGEVSAQVAVNLFDLTTTGYTRIAKPGLGYIAAEEFAANFTYNNGVSQVSQSYLLLGNSRYDIQGRLDLNFQDLLTGKMNVNDIPASAVSGKIAISQAYVQDVLAAFRWYSIEDLARAVRSPVYGNAEDVTTAAVGMPDAPLSEQLQLFARVTAQLQAVAAARQAPAPPTQADVRGVYRGEILVGGTLGNPDIDVALAGENWQWYPQKPLPSVNGEKPPENRAINIDKFILRSDISNGIITVEPLRLELGKTLIYFSGNLSPNGQSGVFTLDNLALDTVRNFVEIPIDIQGNINARAVLGGNINQPEAVGEVSFTDGKLNGASLDRFLAGFHLTDSRFNLAMAQPQFIELFASAPVPPAPGINDNISLNVKLGTQALALLGAFSQKQLEWLGGEGELKLTATGRFAETGTISDLVANGSMTLNDATIQSAAFPDERLKVNGEMAFNQDLLTVANLNAEFADSQLSVAGILPFFTPIGATPLTIALNRGKINIEGLYKGEIGGEVVIAGTAMSPVIGGNIALQNGRLFVPQQRGETQTAPMPVNNELVINDPRQINPAITANPAGDMGGNGAKPAAILPQFDNFRVVLGDNFNLDNSPLFKFLLTGDLTVNGALDNLQPVGSIRLLRGEIDTLSSQFFLTRSYEHRVTFVPGRALDPNIDIKLGTVAFEDTGVRRPNREGAEVRDDLSFSPRPQQINITVGVKGQTSDLLAAVFSENKQDIIDLVELSSIPGRNESEIISLLGTQFLATIQDLQNKSPRDLLEFAVNRYVIEPFYRDVVFRIEDVVSDAGRKVGFQDLRVFPLGQVEGIYAIDDRSFFGISYDYYFRQLEFKYQIRF